MATRKVISYTRYFINQLIKRNRSNQFIPNFIKLKRTDCNEKKVGKTSFLKMLSLYIAAPSILACVLNVLINHKGIERAPFVPYEYMRIRNKRYPWGDGTKTFFHNPRVNALPNGYNDKLNNVSNEK